MNKILVSGLINIETSLEVDRFPIDYSPIEYTFFKINSCVSGVGYNVTKALKTLGSEVTLLSKIGDDINGETIKNELIKNNIDGSHLIMLPKTKTPESVVLVDKDGNRKIYCDLKDIQDSSPLNETHINLDDYSLVVMTNINFNRDLIKAAHDKKITVASDVHIITNINDSYNELFMTYSDILFFSNEAILSKEGDFCRGIYQKYHNQIIVCGCGKEGALMYIGEEDKFYYEKAVAPLGVTSTVGAGDALFSSFIHFYNKGIDATNCLKKAVIFAGIKISQSGGSNGFINEEELERYSQ